MVTVTAFSLNSDDDDEEDGEEPTAGPEHEQRQPRLKGRSVEAEKQKFRIPNVIGKGKNQIRLNGKGRLKSMYWFSPRICFRTLMEYLLHQCSLGAAACCLLVMLTAAHLMTSSHSEGHIKKRSAQPKQRAKKGERKGVGFKGSAGPTGGSDSKKKKKKK